MGYPCVYELPLQGSGARKYDETFWRPSMTSSTVRAVPRSRVRPPIPTPSPVTPEALPRLDQTRPNTFLDVFL